MRYLAFFCLVCCCSGVAAQDMAYLLSGEAREGKIEVVAPDHIIMDVRGTKTRISTSELSLIRFSNHTVKVYQLPERDQVYRGGNQRDTASPEPAGLNLISFNALALVNADLAFSIERLSKNKKTGIGGYAGYNFNPVVLPYNAYLTLLSNCRKHGDIGFFINRYKRQFAAARTFYYGIMIKYSPLTFSSVEENTVTTGSITTTVINYRPATGSMLCFLLSMGNHRQINTHLYLRSQIGIGFYNLKGELKEQYNYMLNKGAQIPIEFTTLPKMFAGLYIGYRF